MKRLAFPLICLVLLAARLGATDGTGDLWRGFPAPILGPDAQISVLTMWPGEPIYIAFGHSALRVQDPAQDMDLIFNYGAFSFDAPWFVPRFVYGDLRYILAVGTFDAQVAYDKRFEQRRWVEQVLDLSAEDEQDLFTFLAWNAQAENREYRYDFVLDNCSTRIIDALETVFGQRVNIGGSQDLGRSARQLIGSYVIDRQWYKFGFDLVLGTTIDRDLSLREASFLPLYLLDLLDSATLDGASRPLVGQTNLLLDPEPLTFTTPWFLSPWFVMGSLMSLALIVLLFDVVTWFSKGTTLGHGLPLKLFDTALFVVLGLFGVVMWYLGLLSLHSATKLNLHLLWLHPFYFLAIPGIFAKTSSGLFRYLSLGSLIMLVVVLILSPLVSQEFGIATACAMGLVGFRLASHQIRLLRHRKS